MAVVLLAAFLMIACLLALRFEKQLRLSCRWQPVF